MTTIVLFTLVPEIGFVVEMLTEASRAGFPFDGTKGHGTARSQDPVGSLLSTGTGNTDSCTACDTSTNSKRRSLAMENTSSVVGTKIVSVLGCAIDVDASFSTILDGAYRGAKVNSVDVCGTKAEDCFGLDRTLIRIPGRLWCRDLPPPSWLFLMPFPRHRGW